MQQTRGDHGIEDSDEYYWTCVNSSGIFARTAWIICGILALSGDLSCLLYLRYYVYICVRAVGWLLATGHRYLGQGWWTELRRCCDQRVGCPEFEYRSLYCHRHWRRCHGARFPRLLWRNPGESMHVGNGRSRGVVSMWSYTIITELYSGAVIALVTVYAWRRCHVTRLTGRPADFIYMWWFRIYIWLHYSQLSWRKSLTYKENAHKLITFALARTKLVNIWTVPCYQIFVNPVQLRPGCWPDPEYVNDTSK